MSILARLSPVLLAVTLVSARPLPACTPYQRAAWPITDRNTIVEGRVILVHTSPDGAKRCGEVKVSTTRPQAPKRKTR